VAARSSWKGYLKLSLVSVPVRGYTAHSTSNEIRLNQLHETCHNRIRYQKVCPVHGEVTQDEIVSGYEYAKGQYVVIDPDELAKLRKERDRSITIDAVVSPDSIDTIYYTDKTYYLLPDGAVGVKPYALIHKSLEVNNLAAVARVVLYGREDIVLVRPYEQLLSMTALKYAAQVTPVSAIAEELGKVGDLNREELTLTRTLLKAFEKKRFKLEAYTDSYVAQLREFIEAKVEGKEIVAPPATEEPHVINLMDALKKSVARAEHEGEPAAARNGKAKRKVAPSSRRSAKKGAKPASKASARRKSG
jgi:DNA end-binding protein Ku